MVDGLIAMHRDRYQASGAELILGSGQFVAPKTLEVRLRDGGARQLIGDRVFLNLGTHATIPPVPGLAEAGPLTHVEILELGRLPEHLIVLGGGFVGFEFAQAYRRFGSRVTIIERGPQIASREDPDVAEEMRRFLEDEGVDILLQTQVERIEGRSGARVSLLARTPEGERTIEGTDLLVAAGHTPNAVGIGLDAAGVGPDARGYVA